MVNEGGRVRACVRYDSPPSTEVTVVLQSIARSGGPVAAQGMKLFGYSDNAHKFIKQN